MTPLDSRREAARQHSGRFGEQQRTAPELTLEDGGDADQANPTLQRLGADREVILTALSALDGNTDELDDAAVDALLADYFEDRPDIIRAADIRTIRDRVQAGFAAHDRARAALQEARALPPGAARDAALAADSQVMKDFVTAGAQVLANYEERSRANRALSALSHNNHIEMKREAMALRDMAHKR